MSTLTVDNIETSSGDNFVSTQISAAKAWVNFNGTGTVSIRDSFNVSSITDGGTGQYQVNFTNPMPNTNYVASLSASGTYNGTVTGTDGYSDFRPTPRTTTAFRFYTRGGATSGANIPQAGAQADAVVANAVFFSS